MQHLVVAVGRVGPARRGNRRLGRVRAGYVGAVAFVAFGLDAAPGEVVLVAGSRFSAHINATVGEIGFLRGIWMDGSKRMAWRHGTLRQAVAAGGVGTIAPSLPAALPDALVVLWRFGGQMRLIYVAATGIAP